MVTESGSSCGHPGSAQMRSVRMSTVVPSGTLISVGSRVRALVRLLADPPLLGTMGSVPRAHGGCRARLAVRETSEGMNLPGIFGGRPARSSGSSSDEGRGS